MFYCIEQYPLSPYMHGRLFQNTVCYVAFDEFLSFVTLDWRGSNYSLLIILGSNDTEILVVIRESLFENSLISFDELVYNF